MPEPDLRMQLRSLMWKHATLISSQPDAVREAVEMVRDEDVGIWIARFELFAHEQRLYEIAAQRLRMQRQALRIDKLTNEVYNARRLAELADDESHFAEIEEMREWDDEPRMPADNAGW